MSKSSETIVLGGGCFWCLEAVYSQVKGVERIIPGYCGGSRADAVYEAVSTGKTGHVEVVKVDFDPSIVTLNQLLNIFWVVHDPTQLNRQGADTGSQYASVIFYRDHNQQTSALASRKRASEYVEDPIVTRIEQLDAFYEAEDYHHNYFAKHPDAAYCQVVISPKLMKLRQHFSSLVNA